MGGREMVNLERETFMERTGSERGEKTGVRIDQGEGLGESECKGSGLGLGGEYESE